MDIRDKALLVIMSISSWTGNTKDKEATEDILRQRKATADSGSFNKHLIPKRLLDPIKASERAIRQYVYSVTLPWTNEGARVLPAALFQEFSAEVMRLNADRERLINDFLNNYPAAAAAAQTRLGGLYKAEDYPTVEALKDKFAFNIGYSPIPDANDFRVSLQESEVARVRESIEAQVKAGMAGAVKSVYERLSFALQKIVTQCSKENPHIYDSVFGNLRDLVALMPALNITADPKLDELHRSLESSLVHVQSDHIRKDKDYRNEIAKEAQDIIDKMMGVFKLDEAA